MEKLAISENTQTINLKEDTLAFALKAVQWLENKKARNIRLYAVSTVCSYTDYILICSGTSDRHIAALAEEVRTEGKKTGRQILGTEGMTQGQWVLIDFGDLIVHIFHSPVRDYYELDRLWTEQRISIVDGSPFQPELHAGETTSDELNDEDGDFDDEDDF